MPFKQFDRSALQLLPLAQREHDLDLGVMVYPGSYECEFNHPSISVLAQKIRAAREKDASVIMMMGAHVIRAGVAPLLIDLMEKGLVTHFALNGAGAIHDFEFALIGATTESVAKYISAGQFGLWNETGRINEAVSSGVRAELGFGEAVGKMIETERCPHKDVSLLAAGYRTQTPVTVHVGIGCDIIHEHPSFSGSDTGVATYTDFLIYADSVSRLENGVFLNFGSAVIGPEVYLKCLSMARNVAHGRGERITRFTTAVFDLLPLEGKSVNEAPPKSDPRYYFRPWKTIMARTVADGGESFYVQGQHRNTITALHQALVQEG